MNGKRSSGGADGVRTLLPVTAAVGCVLTAGTSVVRTDEPTRVGYLHRVALGAIVPGGDGLERAAVARRETRAGLARCRVPGTKTGVWGSGAPCRVGGLPGA